MIPWLYYYIFTHVVVHEFYFDAITIFIIGCTINKYIFLNNHLQINI